MDQENFIPSIYSYCDRRCDKCPFTSRCAGFANDHGIHSAASPETPEFWDALRQNFQDALDQLNDLLQRMGAVEDDLDLPDAEAQTESSYPLPEASDEKDDLEKEAEELSQKYRDDVNDFFKNNEAYFESQGQETEDRLEMGLPIDLESLGFVREAVDTIRWYQNFIGVKIARALSGREEMLSNDVENPQQSDANGSAKIAMISLQRSVDAWKQLSRFFPEKRLEITRVSITLEALRSMILRCFPDWNAFHRPGFDDEPGTVLRLDFNPN